jgi:hypothetical protein
VKTVQATPEQMQARIARFDQLGTWSVQSNPRLPQEARDLVYARRLLAITSPSGAERPLANSAPIRDVDFTLHVAECPPGQGPGLHVHHAATETYFSAFGPGLVTELERTGLRFDAGVDD